MAAWTFNAPADLLSLVFGIAGGEAAGAVEAATPTLFRERIATLFAEAGGGTQHDVAGIDELVFPGARELFAPLREDAGGPLQELLQGLLPDLRMDLLPAVGSDPLAGFERLQFSDGALALDLDGHAGTVARLVGTLFGPGFLAREDLVGVGLGLLDAGLSESALAELALASDEFAALAGSRTNADFVQQVYGNVFGSAPPAAEQALYTGLLDGGVFTQASLALLAAQTELIAGRIDLVGLAQRGLDFLPFDG